MSSDQHRTPPSSANMKGWGDAQLPQVAFLLALLCCAVLSAWLGPACWHGLTMPVSGFCDSSLHPVPVDRSGHFQRMSSKRQVCSGPCRPTRRQGLSTASGHPGFARHSTAQPAPPSCLEGSRSMSGLTLVLTYSFCNNPLSPNSRSFVF